MVVTEFCQEYVGTPLTAEIVPFASTQADKIEVHEFTGIIIDSEPQLKV